MCAGNDGVVCAPAQGALVAALALSLAPEGEAFLPPGALRAPALRAGAAATASRPARRSSTAPQMSDLSDKDILQRVATSVARDGDLILLLLNAQMAACVLFARPSVHMLLPGVDFRALPDVHLLRQSRL